MVITTAQKVYKHLGYFCSKICSQKIPKIAQSGLTVTSKNVGIKMLKCDTQKIIVIYGNILSRKF